MIELPDYAMPACMAEGGAETAILDILLDNDLLVFSREALYQKKILPRVGGREFADRYLRYGLSKPLFLFRVIDSKAEKFRLPTAYQKKVTDYRILTRPEIEMLIIISEGKYTEYERYRNSRKSENRPSDFCVEKLRLKDVKKPKFVNDYFADPEKLVSAIREYRRVHKQEKGDYSIFDLLKE